MISVVLSCLAFGTAILAFIRAWLDHRVYIRERDRLRGQLAEAERLIRYRGNLANEIAHEIKNPITAILCSAETLDLLLKDKLSEDHRKSLHYIRDFGDSLLRLVSDFLDVSRAEAGKIICRPQAVQVSPVVDGIIGLLQPSALRKDINLKHLSTDRALRVRVDQIHIKQVVFNLLYNALKFTPRGGEVQVSIESAFPQPFVQISVRDNGPGIPKDYLSRLFDPYVRYEHKRPDDLNHVGTGVGLGLSLCKSLVDLAEGDITVESEEGVGTVFVVRLPAAEVSEPNASGVYKLGQPSPFGNGALAGQKVLIVEQDHGTRDSVARLIEAWGGSVKQVSEAIEAVNALAGGEFTSVIVDSQAIEDNQNDLMSLLSSTVRSAKTRVVVAAESEEELYPHSDRNRNFCRIQKPFSGERLLHVLLDKDEGIK